MNNKERELPQKNFFESDSSNGTTATISARPVSSYYSLLTAQARSVLFSRAEKCE